MLSRLVMAAAFLTAVPASADTGSHQRLAEELLVEMKVGRMLEQTIRQVREMQNKESPPPETGSQAERRRLQRDELVERSLGWESCKGDFIRVFTEEFGEDELKEIVAFQRSPAGRKYLEKTPVLRERVSAIIRERVRLLLPELKANGKAPAPAPKKLLNLMPEK